MFFRNYSKNQVQRRPTLHSVDGGNVYNTPNMAQNIEANLDLEYAMALVNPLNVTLYQVGDLVNTQWTSFNNFLDALDSNYCSRDGQTENVTTPEIDAVYPSKLPGGFSGPRNCGGWTPTKVISTSYSYNEHDLTPAYERRQCNEYAKLGLAGTTFLYCSADYGVAASQDRCIDPSTGDFNDGTSGNFAPSFPSTCPWVTSIGATQIAANASITAPEVACETGIRSGGGFSNVFALPSYQSAAVAGWMKKYSGKLGFGKDRWNSNGKARAYPDISANGAGYVVALVGSFDYKLYGTSAGTPVVGAVVMLLNEARMNRGMGSLGFLSMCCLSFFFLWLGKSMDLVANVSRSGVVRKPVNAERYHEGVKLRMWNTRLLGHAWMGSSDWTGHAELPSHAGVLSKALISQRVCFST